MKKKVSLRVKPSEAADESFLKQLVSASVGRPVSSVSGFAIFKKSIDARSRQVFINISLEAFIDEPFHERELSRFNFQDVATTKKRVIIIGAGPAGLFAALSLLEAGVKPIILERGKDVKARRRDLAVLNKEGIINPESNYCFGEGGAGTYSDGKLYTRSSKRGDINRILNLLVYFGAGRNILYESHPHIGTNKLPAIISAMRNHILGHGGEILFEKKVVDFEIRNDRIGKVITADGDRIHGDAVILATGHSARDIFQLLSDKSILIECKPFALGVRVEHPQELIDSVQYHSPSRDAFLPPSSYSLVQQVDGKGVFSFCMCPGGIIAPASTSPGELVVNGWSPSRRNNPYANSGIVVSVDEKDLAAFNKYGPLAGMYFQQTVEKNAFEAGGGKFRAPAQRLVDFTESKSSINLSSCSYLPGVSAADINGVLPPFISSRLRIAFIEFGKKMRGYFTNEAIIVAAESRTSSPVRIPRNPDSLHHPQIVNLYPCGEGAGYAGGIVSAAMDGEKVANTVCINISSAL